MREVPGLAASDPLPLAVRCEIDSGIPGLPVIDGGYCGIFGEREFITAAFPGYLGELKHAGFVPRSLESALQKRATCRDEPVRDWMNTEHVEPDYSDAQVAGDLLPSSRPARPSGRRRRVRGVIARNNFFRALAGRVLDG